MATQNATKLAISLVYLFRIRTSPRSWPNAFPLDFDSDGIPKLLFNYVVGPNNKGSRLGKCLLKHPHDARIRMDSWLHIRLTSPTKLIGIPIAHSDAKPDSDTTTVMPPIANVGLL